MVKQVKDINEFLKLTGQENVTVIIDFTATWCPPCKKIGPVFESLANSHQSDKLVFIKVDVDEGQEISANCGIECMPTFQVYRGGKQIEQFSGADENKLKDLVAKYKA